MNNRFSFESALAAAKVSPEAFAEEFKKDGADANTQNDLMVSLIHQLIEDISDDNLPDLLQILVENKVDIEIINQNYLHTPVCAAAYYGRRKAMDFLIENGAEIHNPKHFHSVLESALESPISYELIKHLIEHHRVHIDCRVYSGQTALMVADSTEIVNYLCSHKPNLLLSTRSGNTALSLSHGKVFSDPKIIKAKEKFTIIQKAARQFLYNEAVSFIGTEQELQNKLRSDISLLAGCNNVEIKVGGRRAQDLKQELEKLLESVLEQVKAEKAQRHAFFLPSEQSEAQKKSQPQEKDPAIYSEYFQSPIFDKNTVAMIFSFLHKQHPGADKKPIAESKTDEPALINANNTAESSSMLKTSETAKLPGTKYRK